jgi:hypothetical protein
LKNKYRKRDGYVSIILQNKRGQVGIVKIDNEDFEKVQEEKWYLSVSKKWRKSYYRVSKIDKKTHASTVISQFILGRKKGLVIDHINGNTLDNRKKNLRHVSFRENTWNNAGKGYYKDKRLWYARIQKDGFVHRKKFEKESDAIKWRLDMKENLFGRFARPV